MLLTRSPLVYPRRGLTARLACVKHAASVRPEPGSNSPLKNMTNQPKLESRQSKSDPLNQKQNHYWLVIRNNFKGIHPQTKQNPHPKIKDPGQGTRSTPVDRVNASFGIDFRHAVEFSRIGRTPQPDLSARLPGQPAVLYRSRSTESSSIFLTRHPHPSYRPESDNPVRLSQPWGVRSDRPLSRPAPRSNKKNITWLPGDRSNRLPVG